MQSRIIITIAILSLALASTAALAGKPNKAKGGSGDPEVTSDFLAFTSSLGLGGRAGMVLNVTSNIGGVGASSTLIDASWDWGLYSSLHPCGLMDSDVSPELDNHLTAYPFAKINYMATITIAADKNGDKIVGDITGDSVCELSVTGPLASTNEWLIGFQFDGSLSTGTFAGRSGSGYINFRIDSDPGVADFVGPFQISLNLGN